MNLFLTKNFTTLSKGFYFRPLFKSNQVFFSSENNANVNLNKF